MAEYQVVIVSPQGETWDVTERVSTLTWSGSIKRVSRSVEAVMATPNDGSLPELPCELGNELGPRRSHAVPASGARGCGSGAAAAPGSGETLSPGRRPPREWPPP